MCSETALKGDDDDQKHKCYNGSKSNSTNYYYHLKCFKKVNKASVDNLHHQPLKHPQQESYKLGTLGLSVPMNHGRKT